MPNITPKQRLTALRQLLETDSALSPEAIAQAFDNHLFYTDATICFNNDYTIGSTEWNDIPLPYLTATADEPLADIKDEQARYAKEIANGERDEDDEYDGVLVMVRWDGGENLTFLCPDTQSELGTQTLTDACGW